MVFFKFYVEKPFVNKLKMDKGLKYKSRRHRSPRGEPRQENLRYSTQQYFHQYVTSHLSEWLSSINQQIGVGEDVEKRELSCTVGAHADWCIRDGKQ